jgi:hypothetical protein
MEVFGVTDPGLDDDATYPAAGLFGVEARNSHSRRDSRIREP